jgi:transcriptional regulator with XRE-family HTH domain
MGETSNTDFPYKSLGTWLRRMRLKKQETLAEVSGAVEIDVTNLADMEKGVRRPSEDILMLFISYFSVSEEESVKLWELAGYDTPDELDDEPTKESPSTVLQPIIVVPMDARVVYTDNVQVEESKYGVTINFHQSSGVQGKSVPVSRVGMSREQAEKLLQTLTDKLSPKQQKLLPKPTDHQKSPWIRLLKIAAIKI